jgi:predicted nucleotidyltransferase
MLRRVAEVLNARVRVILEARKSAARAQVAERAAAYRNDRNAPHREAERNYGRRESRSSALQRPAEKNKTGVNMTAAKIDRRFLQTIVQRIRSVTEPERIVLFGSAARGEMGPDSDLDILVVTACDHRRNTARKIRRALFGIDMPIDIIVAKPQDLERYGDASGLIYRPALKEGTVLYAA